MTDADDNGVSYLVPPQEWAGLGLPEITYKPGWCFAWERDEDGRMRLWIHVEYRDATAPEDEMEVDFSFIAPMPFDPKWLWNRLAGIEDHETREWLRVSGERPFDPHRDDDLLALPTLRSVLAEAREELTRWGWGDFHYGNQPQEKSVVDMVAKIDAALGAIGGRVDAR